MDRKNLNIKIIIMKYWIIKLLNVSVEPRPVNNNQDDKKISKVMKKNKIT